MIKTFLWNNKHPRLRLSLLFFPYDTGGLQLPNPRPIGQYNTAMFYFSSNSPHGQPTNVVRQVVYLFYHIFILHILKHKKQTQNPFVKNTISVWHGADTYTGGTPKMSQFSSIWGNDGGFKQWADKGLSKIADLYGDGRLMTLDQLVHRCSIPRKHYFMYLQLRSFITSQTHSLEEPPLSDTEKITTVYYAKIQIPYNQDVMPRDYLQVDITKEKWETSCLQAQMQTINTALKLLQYK